MRHHDKLEKYIKKEVDSIPYDEGVDEMWEAFQSENAEQLNPKNSSKYFLPILVVLFSISAIGIFFLKNNNVSTISQQTSTTSSSASSQQETATITTTRLDEQKINLSNETTELQQADLKELNSPTVGNNISNKSITKSNSSEFNTQNTRTQTLTNTRTSTPSGLPSFGEFSKTIENNGLTESTTFQQSSTSNSFNSLESNFENQSKSMALEVKETIASRENIALLNPLSSTINDLQLIDFEETRLTELSISEIKRLRPRYFRAAFSASTNQITRSAFEYGRIRKISSNRGWKYGVGLGLDDGYSLSQDSLIYINGIVIQEILKDKDLDFLVQSFVSGEYFLTKNRWTIGVGTKVNFALLSRFRTFEHIRYLVPLPQPNSSSGSNGIILNDWNGINRFSLDGFLNLSYRVNNLEFGLNASKRFNKVIKKERAGRNKFNLPVQVGAHISKYF